MSQPQPGLPSQEPAPLSPERTLTMIRVIWGLLFAGQAVLAIVAAIIIRTQPETPLGDASAIQLLTIVACVLLVTNTFMGVFVRNQVYKKNWQGQVVSPAGYFTGNLLMFAFVEGVVLLGLGLYILARSFGPGAVPTVLAMAIYAVNFPHGGPMFGRQEPSSFKPKA